MESPIPPNESAPGQAPVAMDDPSRELLISVPQDGILELTLNRPRTGNALNRSLLRALKHAFEEAAGARRIKAVILSATGRAFCAGHDLKEFVAARDHADRGQEYYEETFGLCNAVMTAIRDCPKPVIARVQGVATAAGCQLVATCDLAVASDTATFATPGVNIGLFCSTPQVSLSRAIGPKKALEMLLTGAPVSAAEAEKAGLINRAVAPDRLDEAVYGLARTIASKSAAVVALGKAGFYKQLPLDVADAYALCGRIMSRNAMLPQAAEGIDAFLQKRDPVWPDEG